MKKIVLISGLALLIVGVVGVVIYYRTTKSHSPEGSASFEDGDLVITVAYNRPYKKGRVIFGGLVPYGKTWRTGANEPTVFETNKDLLIAGKVLSKGRYSLWTVPGELSWQVVFNSTIPPWGIDVMKEGKPAREPATDVIIAEVPVVHTEKEFEQFTISIEKNDEFAELILAWDKTLVAVPVQLSGQ